MNFIKNFFNDESTIVGLSGFKTTTEKSDIFGRPEEMFFNPFITKVRYETIFKGNVMLKV